jgi:glutaminyl-tRNA synthetase
LKGLGDRDVAFSKEIYIEREDFIEQKPNKKWKRLAIGEEVRLMHAYFIKANKAIYNDQGTLIEIHATYDKETRSGSGF